MIRAPKGIEGVIVATTSLTKIDGQAGRLIYRGYDVTQLAGRVPYESVAHLLWFGHLPNQQELSTLQTRFSHDRRCVSPIEKRPGARRSSNWARACSELSLHAQQQSGET